VTAVRLVEDVAAMCRRLIPFGWGELLACHGLRLDRTILENPTKLAAELNRSLKIDRTMPGFEDFWPDGKRAVHPGRPSRSLLYHALASPLVHPAKNAPPSAYPTLRELDTLENYIYASRKVTLEKLTPSKKSGAILVVGVFAYQYRIGARSPNGKFASTALSRTGIARVGTAAAHYDPMRRSFWPVPKKLSDQMAVLPARYAAYLAELRSPGPEDAILDEQPGDEDRNFLFPVHKLFNGNECLLDRKISVQYSERHVNEKMRRFHTETGVEPIAGFDISKSPFVRDSAYEADLVYLEDVGDSVLVVPVPHGRLTRIAVQKNRKTRRNEVARFIVPRAFGDNRFAGTSFQFLDPNHAERRIAPEYINIRHKVLNPAAPGKIKDLNTLPWKKFDKTVRRGNYEAAHFIDDSCEGCLVAEVSGVPMIELNKTNFPAFSIVAAPDFFPLVDQADVTDWVNLVLGVGGEREQFAQGGPWPLSGTRRCVNPRLLLPDTCEEHAFPVRDGDFARIENVTAVIGGKVQDGTWQRVSKDRRFDDPSTSFLSDGASGIFDPGWDVSLSGENDADFLASFGLGSPFPEDVKLCSALNSFWPSVAPDATRTFALSPPEWDATTSVPLMDDELGIHPRRPDWKGRKRLRRRGWDGEFGPFFERGFTFVNHAHIEQSDYVSHALVGQISLRQLAQIDAPEMFRRMRALRDAIAALPEKPKRVSATPLVLVIAESVVDWSARTDCGDPRLRGEGFLFVFARLVQDGTPAKEHGRWRRKVQRRYTCQISRSALCWKRESPGEKFVFVPRPS
jgi:hypothetical protein